MHDFLTIKMHDYSVTYSLNLTKKNLHTYMIKYLN